MAPPVLAESGVAVTRRELDRLMCDSAITRVIFGPRGEVLDVGRTYRTFTGARRRALDAHDGGCAYPGCDLPPCQCEGHHTRDGGWAGGATTNTDEGILLCYHHHPWVHDHDITITRDHLGDWQFTDRWGIPLGTTRPRSLRRPPLDHQPLEPDRLTNPGTPPRTSTPHRNHARPHTPNQNRHSRSAGAKRAVP